MTTVLAHGGHVVPALSLNEVALRALVLCSSGLVGGAVLLARTRNRSLLQPLASVIGIVAVLLSVRVSGTSSVLAAVHAGLLLVCVIACTEVLPREPLYSRVGTTAGAGLVVLVALEGAAGSSGGFWVAALIHGASASVWLGVLALVVEAPDRKATIKQLTLPAIGASVAIAVTGLVQAWIDRVGLDGFAFDRVVIGKATLFAIACAAGVLGLRRIRASRVELVALATAAVLGGLLAAVPSAPKPGPLVSAAGGLGVTVVPQRPGLNLVHIDTAEPTTVNGQPTTTYPGTTGQWARVRLGEGRTRLTIGSKKLLVDAGEHKGLVPDGPECASAMLLAAEQPAACPSQDLRSADALALTDLVGWLHRRGVTEVDVQGDATPRSKKAQQLLTTTGTHGALILTGDWATTARQLSALERQAVPRDGIYLAPWLLNGPLLTTYAATGPLVALPFDPKGQQALDYAASLPEGETPSAAGFLAYGGKTTGTQVFGTTPASIFPTSLGHGHATTRGWFPGGSLVPITGVL